MDEVPKSFVAHATMGAHTVDVTVLLSKSELEIWGVHNGVPWMKISSLITDRTVTQNRTVDGDLVIVNWSVAQVVTYDNPWIDIPRDQAIKFKEGGRS